MTIPHDDRRMGESELRNIIKDKDENFFLKKLMFIHVSLTGTEYIEHLL